jgi:hypothetical protein
MRQFVPGTTKLFHVLPLARERNHHDSKGRDPTSNWQSPGTSVTNHAAVDSQTLAPESRGDRVAQLSRRRIVALTIAGAIVVAVIAEYFRYLVRYAINGVYWDEWTWVDLMRRGNAGTLTLDNLWSQHNENRMLFPNVIVLLLGNATGFSDIAFMYLGAILLVAAVLLLIVGCRRDFSEHPLAYVPAIFVFFSFAQYENTLWGFQFAWFLIVACICGVLVLLTAPRLRPWQMLASVAIGIVASYSSLAGLTIWGAGLLALLRPGISMRLRLIWCAIGVFVGLLYVYGLNFANLSGAPLSGFLDRLPTALNGFLVAVGSVVPDVPLATRGVKDFSVTAVFGGLITFAALVVLVSWIAHRRNDRVLTIAAGLIVVGLSFDLLLMPTRVSAAVINGTASKYTTFNLLLLGGVFMGAVRTMIVAMGHGAPRRTAISGAFVGLSSALLLVQIPSAIFVGEFEGIKTRALHAEAANLTANYAIAPPSLVKAFAYPHSYQYFQLEAVFLETNHLNVFANGESAAYRQSGVLAGGVVTSPLPVPPEFGNIRSEATRWRAWLALSSVYDQRPDLETAFPGPTVDASRRMVAWAVRSGQNPTDSTDAAVLIPYSEQYTIWLGLER